MIEEKKRVPEDSGLGKLELAYKQMNLLTEDLVEAGAEGARKGYYHGKLDVYKRMLNNLNKMEDGIDSFFMGSLWKDINNSRTFSHRGRTNSAVSEL